MRLKITIMRSKNTRNLKNTNYTSRPFDPSSLFDTSDEILKRQPSNIIYIENKNNTIFTNSINIYQGGYIFPILPYPFEYVPNDDDPTYYHIAEVYPVILNPTPIKITTPNLSKKFVPIQILEKEKSPSPITVVPGPAPISHGPGPIPIVSKSNSFR